MSRAAPAEIDVRAWCARRPVDMYRLSRLERTRAWLEALRQALAPRPILVVGPYTGEFGYELRFHGFAAARARHYRKTYVLSYPGRQALYPGCTFLEHPIPLEAAGYGHGRFTPADQETLARLLLPDVDPSSYDQFTTALYASCIFGRPLWFPEYRVLSAAFEERDRTDLLLHFRSVRKEGWDSRPDFTGEHADRLWRACTDRGLRVACFGHPQYSYCPPGCLDFRSEDLGETIGKISATRLVVGQQSGGAHLANYCGKPTVIWASSRTIIRNGLRLNPHRVPIAVVTDTTWLPPVEAILRTLSMVLERLGMSRPLLPPDR